MIGRLFVFAATGLFLVTAGGCFVSESAYLKKTDEADGLTKELTDLRLASRKLGQENSALRTRLTGLTEHAENLTADKKQLESILKAKSDTLSKNINDLRQQVAEMKVENGKLNDDLSELQKTKENGMKELNGIYEQLLSDMKNEIAQGQVTIAELKGSLTVTVQADVLFDPENAEIRPEGRQLLDKTIVTLKNAAGRNIRVEGHTDSDQSTGTTSRTFPTSWELSAARAIRVTRYFQDQGIEPLRLSATAFAEYQPVTGNETADDRSRNRRINIILTAKD